MNSLTRKLLLILLAACCFAAWSWFRPYQWNSPAAARFRIHEAAVTQDHQFYWLKLHLTHLDNTPEHDWQQPITLEFPDEKTKTPDKLERSLTPDGKTNSLELAFWLEPAQLQQALQLQINGTKLTVKTSNQLPSGNGTIIHHSCNW